MRQSDTASPRPKAAKQPNATQREGLAVQNGSVEELANKRIIYEKMFVRNCALWRFLPSLLCRRDFGFEIWNFVFHS
jgi:hypothetical protein